MLYIIVVDVVHTHGPHIVTRGAAPPPTSLLGWPSAHRNMKPMEQKLRQHEAGAKAWKRPLAQAEPDTRS